MTETDVDQFVDLIGHLNRCAPDDCLGEHFGGDGGHGFEDFGTLVALRDEVDYPAKPLTERMWVTELVPEGVGHLRREEAQRGPSSSCSASDSDAAAA